jgi:hypothetical protein
LAAEKETFHNQEGARAVDLPERQTRDRLRGWVEDGRLEFADPSRKGRRDRLAEKYRRFAGGVVSPFSFCITLS